MENQHIQDTSFFKKYQEFKEKDLKGRLLTHSGILSSLEKLRSCLEVSEVGKSALEKSIHSTSIGSGKIKILAWSQMHGNESTTTKAVFDLLNGLLLLKNDRTVKNVLNKIELKIIPFLNPDGAEAYTRENANKIDLNRDASNLLENESRILQDVFRNFKPDFCLNLHDQRTIFSAGGKAEPAVLSFLTPAMDEERTVTLSRKQSMKVIVSIARDLQPLLKGKIGRYDDSYNPNCTGDTFQSLDVPTLLFEAGHYPGDYQREKTREFVTYALFSTLINIASGKYEAVDYREYFKIPENQKLFFDVILRNARINGKIVDVAIQFKETPHQKQIFFVPFLEKIESSLPFFGHKEIDCNEREVKWEGSLQPSENVIVNKIFMNNEILIIN